MATRTEDVEALKKRIERRIGPGFLQHWADGSTKAWPQELIDDIRTILASHAALTAFVTNVAEPHHASDHYSMATAFERFQTRARAILSGKASA